MFVALRYDIKRNAYYQVVYEADSLEDAEIVALNYGWEFQGIYKGEIKYYN